MKYDNIESNGSWGNQASKLNINFDKTNAELLQLQAIAEGGGKLFSSLDAVKSAYPSPPSGLYALVSSSLTFPATVYQYNGTEWVAGGTSNGGDAVENIDAEITRRIVHAVGNDKTKIFSQYGVSLLISSINNSISALDALIKSITDDGFHVTDDNGNVILKCNNDGLDAAKLSTHFISLIKAIEGIGLALGETSTTAYAGDKGKANADNIASLTTSLTSLSSSLTTLQTSVSSLSSTNSAAHSSLQSAINALSELINSITENGFHVVDSAGNVGLKYDDSGLDTALLSSHFITLIKAIEGIGLALGETSTTAYAGDKGKANADNIASLTTSLTSLSSSLTTLQTSVSSLSSTNSAAHSSLQSAINALSELINSITENGFHVVDSAGNVGLKYDDSGLDAALLSSHFQSLINALITTALSKIKVDGSDSRICEVDDNGFFIVDSSGYVLFSVTPSSGINFSSISAHAVSVLNDAGIGGSGLSYTVVSTIDV